MSGQSNEPGTIVSAEVRTHPAGDGPAVEVRVWLPAGVPVHRGEINEIAGMQAERLMQQVKNSLAAVEPAPPF